MTDTDLGQYDLPSAEDILQETAPEELDRDPGTKTHDILPVRVEGIVRTETPGGRTSVFRLFEVTTTRAERILDDDPRRAVATIIPIGADIRLGFTQSDALSNGSVLLPAGVPLVLNTSDEVWAGADVTTTEISVFSELWAR